MKIPFFTLDRQSREIKDTVLDAIGTVIDSSMFILGTEVEELEKALSNYIDSAEFVSVSSGTEALRLCLLLNNIGFGDEVITVSNSYFATAAAIAMVGATPVFVDIEPDSMLLDPTRIEKAVTANTKAIIPVHYNGYPCNLELIHAIADAYNVVVIEDCAQAFGSKTKNRHVGSDDFGCFSFHPLKVFGGYGDGGGVSLSSVEYIDTLKQLRNNGLVDRDNVAHISGNYRLDTLQAAVLLQKLKYIDSWLMRRKKIGQYYLENLKGIRLPVVEKYVDFNFSSFVVRHPKRDALLRRLNDKGIDCKVQYPIAIHQQPPYSKFSKTSLPITEKVVSEIISIPISQDLTDIEVEFVVDSINSIASLV
ncbi:DegT/DnrJ/EryC1/StrS aminotransferase family protein [Aliikangiella sp. G2MR2-5]|uniref:DegT/DnrJ/EryC1/StrS family aminotransferase n=1 Tax=Aliikangiella sp. G2MR2-5 TaxID=2788943 RepID=UPI0018AA5C51|nr:DegT/DnrJ/EryC1/StrS family aminotransferase [Aliikangiella sp. G2MR2-5]